MNAPKNLEKLASASDVDVLFQRSFAVIYKHSTMCSVSSVALTELEAFASSHPNVVVHRIDVIENRAVSDYVERKSGVRHQSPQLLVIKDGEVAWTASHFGVTAEALSRNLS